jgi:hypothetical protein
VAPAVPVTCSKTNRQSIVNAAIQEGGVTCMLCLQDTNDIIITISIVSSGVLLNVTHYYYCSTTLYVHAAAEIIEDTVHSQKVRNIEEDTITCLCMKYLPNCPAQ